MGDELKGFQFRNHILFAELQNLPGEVAVLPDILCGEVKQGGRVHAKARKGATPPLKGNEKKNKEVSKQTLFFIKSTKRGITKIPNSEYEGKLLCVDAYDGDTLQDAINNDGRFTEQFMLLEDNDRQSDVPLHYAASDHSREVFIMKRRPAKRKLADKPDRGGERETESQTSSTMSVYSSLPQKIDDPFSQEIGKSMVNDARRNAKEAFIESGREEETDKYIRNMVAKFGKKDSAAIPTRILPTLSTARESIGYINCGTVTGTCFLLTGKIIITCFHIFSEINSKRSETTDPELFREIQVYFDYEYPNRQQRGKCMAVVDESKKPTIGQGLDFIIHFLKPTTVMGNRRGLGYLIRSPVPRDGLVTLIGHPESREKVFEVCQIIPRHNWHATLCSRASEAEHHCEQNPHECQMNAGPNVQCIHMHKGRYYQGNHPNELPYDTSFFFGASGSPVFNADGHIIAMHTQGYPYYRFKKQVSLMEFGVMFQAIYEDVKKQIGDQAVKSLFPKILPGNQ